MNGRNWYAVYTKPNTERKVAALLSKKKIENFCPHKRVISGSGSKRKLVYVPLFPNFVFVHILESEMPAVRNISEVCNFVYWLGKPAVIKTNEIENIAQFNGQYYNIEVEKMPVNPTGVVRISSIAGIGNTPTGIEVKTKKLKLVLPSLGFAMHAETLATMENDNEFVTIDSHSALSADTASN